LAHLVRVDQPLLVVTQVPRSGGTLLCRLFDAHPQLHCVPHELGRMFGGMRALVAGSADPWSELTPPKQLDRLESGYEPARPGLNGNNDAIPFAIPPALQRAIFEACLAELDRPSPRAVMDCYFTSYFNGWLDNSNLRSTPKRWVVGFEPGMTGTLSTVKRTGFEEIYPDGRVISLIRDPWNWYASARRWASRYRDLEAALQEWRDAAETALSWSEMDPLRVRIVPFARLTAETGATVRGLASWLGVDFAPILLQPTFNGLPVPANSSFSNASQTVSTAPLDRARSGIDSAERAYIDRHATELYERMIDQAERSAAAGSGGSV
jgi:hypothetical protein